MPTETFSIVFEIDGRRVVGEANRISGSTDAMTRSVGAAQRALLALGVGISLAAAARSIVQISIEFEQLRARLQAVTGSAEAARQTFEWIKEFAATTPFEVGKLTEAFVLLTAKGFNPTAESFRAVGNMAAAFGRDIVDASQAITQAMLGEAEGLKQFGIVLRQQGDQAVVTFRGASQTISNDAESIKNAVLGIADANFGDAMERQMDTAAGAISNLKDAWAQLADTIGQSGLLDVITQAVQGITRGLEAVQSVLGGTNATFTDFVRGIQAGFLQMVADAAAGIARWANTILDGIARMAAAVFLAIQRAPAFLRVIMDPTGSYSAGSYGMVRALDELRGQINRWADGVVQDFEEAAQVILRADRATNDLAASLPGLGQAGTETGQRLTDATKEHLDALQSEREALEKSVELLRERLRLARDQPFFFDESLATAGQGSIPQDFSLSLLESSEQALLDAVLAVFGPQGKAIDMAEDWAGFVGRVARISLEDAIANGLIAGIESNSVRAAFNALVETFAQVFGQAVSRSVSSQFKNANVGAVAGGLVGAFFDVFATALTGGFKSQHQVDRLGTFDALTGAVEGLSRAASDLAAAAGNLRGLLQQIQGLTGAPLGTFPTSFVVSQVDGVFNVSDSVGLLHGEGETLQAALDELFRKWLDFLRRLEDEGLDPLAGMPEVFKQIILDSTATSLADLVADLEVAAEILKAGMDPVQRAIFDAMNDLSRLVAEGIRLGLSRSDLNRAVRSGIEDLISGIAGADLFPTFVDAESALAELQRRMEGLGLSARTQARYLDDARVAIDLFNDNLELDVLQRMVNVMERIPGMQEEARRLQAEIDQARFIVELAILEIQLRSLGLWQDFSDVMRRARNFAEDINNFLPEDLRVEPGSQTVDASVFGGGSAGSGDVVDAVYDSNEGVTTALDAQIDVERQILASLDRGFGALDMTTGDTLIEAAINRQTDLLIGSVDRLDRTVREEVGGPMRSGFNRLGGALEARTRQQPTV